MLPPTFHLIAQWIRFERGKLTALEKWVSQQEPGPATAELSSFIRVMREVQDSYEAQLARAEIRSETVETVNT